MSNEVTHTALVENEQGSVTEVSLDPQLKGANGQPPVKIENLPILEAPRKAEGKKQTKAFYRSISDIAKKMIAEGKLRSILVCVDANESFRHWKHFVPEIPTEATPELLEDFHLRNFNTYVAHGCISSAVTRAMDRSMLENRENMKILYPKKNA